MRDIKKARAALGLKVRFLYDQPMEFNDWEAWYVPPPSVPKDGLIVDIGARDGDTLLFWAEHGYKRFRLIEPNPKHFERLLENIDEIKRIYDVDVEAHEKTFDQSDLEGADFIKFDCEGCEYELVLDNLKVPWVAEMHEYQRPDEHGIYSNYVHATKYRRGP